MMEFYVSGQSLKFFTPAVAADSLNYLTAKVNFTDSHWDGASKWLHFRRGDKVYDLELDEKDEISADQQLNLTVGQWEIYLTGTKGESRLTTVPVILTVQQSGLVDAPLHELPMSVAERVDFNAIQALLLAQAVKDMADEGKFDGKPGTSFAPLGYYTSLSELEANVVNPSPGDVYGVGSAAPYDMYSWDGVNLVWVNNGPIQGAAGDKGEDGAVFIPTVDANGNISWTNNGGLENPVTRNIRGPAGPTGNKGEDGAGAYEKAQEAGYTGTEATFYQALTAMPYHNARHLPDGADPITVQTGNIKDAAVTRAKLADYAVSKTFSGTLLADNWTAVNWGGYQTVYFADSGILSHTSSNVDSQHVEVGLDTGAIGNNAGSITADEMWSNIFRAIPVSGGVQFNFKEIPSIDLPVYARVVYK